MRQAIAKRGRVRVVLDDGCGEGIDGDYNPEDPADVPIMRFGVELKTSGRWEFVEDTSYCTQIDARIKPAERARLATLILNKVYGACVYRLEHGHDGAMSLKKMCERLSWINATWGTPNETTGWTL